MAEGVKYIKVAKIDANGVDQTLSLQSLSELTIPYSTGNVRYEILSISEQPTYFLYSVDNPNIEHADAANLLYSFTGSLISVPSESIAQNKLAGTDFAVANATVETDNLNQWINGPTPEFLTIPTGSGFYTNRTYPQKIINVRVTGSISAVISSSAGTSGATAENGDTYNIALLQSFDGASIIGPVSWVPSTTATASFDLNFSTSSPGSSNSLGAAYILIYKNASGTRLLQGYKFHGDSYFYISSSAATGPTMDTIPEPFFTQNFNRAFDCQPTLNNVSTNRLSSEYQDIDYSSGIMTPVNFDLLISGSALKAEVQDSNYTLKRHILPRYEGSKSTSQFLNVFTRGDKGNYGTAPTVEQLDTLVAYADWTGGYLPEHNNAFGAHLKYLIKSNGDVVIPGSTPNSLEDNKNIFNTGDLIEISSETQTSNGDPGELRSVIRGGKRITPILTNQHGHSPAAFSSSMEMVNIDGKEIGTVTNDFNGSFNNNSFLIGQTLTRSGSFIDFQAIRVQSSGSHCNVNSSKLIISQSMIDQGISLTIEGDIKFKINKNQAGPIKAFAIIKNTTTDEILAEVAVNGTGELSDNDLGVNNGRLNIQHTINNTDMIIGHEYGIQVAGIVPDIGSVYTFNNYPFYVDRGSVFKVTQNPIPGTEVLTAGLWTSGSLADCSWPYTIISSNSTLVNFYSNNQAKQQNNAGSGFFDFENYWGIEPGDEFRFEAREDRVFTIKEAYVSSSKLFIEVDKDLPPSGSVGISGSMNYNNFLIRRYVDDPSGLIIEGSKPTGDGPYIVKSQYINQELNENLPIYIENLKEKGII